MQPVPRLITSLSRETVVKVAAGKVHSVAITSQPLLFPSLIYYLSIVSLLLHSFFLSEFGQVFTWGDSPAGQLGHGDLKIHVRPKVVAKLFGKTVVDVAAGDLHTVFVTGELNHTPPFLQYL